MWYTVVDGPEKRLIKFYGYSNKHFNNDFYTWAVSPFS